MQLAKRWTGPAALEAGIAQGIAETDSLLEQASRHAQELAPLGTNRANYQGQKEALFGENAAINQPHGAAYMLRNLDQYSH